MPKNEVRRVRLATVEELPTTARTLRAAAIKAGFEVIVTKVEETGLVRVDGVHHERGRFECAWINGRTHSGFWAPPHPVAVIVPDLRSTDPILRDDEGEPILDSKKKPKRNPNRKPSGIGLERVEYLGGYVGLTAVRAWIG